VPACACAYGNGLGFGLGIGIGIGMAKYLYLYLFSYVVLSTVCVADALTVGHILIKVIAIGLIALHMVIGAGRCRCGCCIRGGRGGRAEGAGRLGVEFSGKLMDAGEGAAERGEVHHVRIGVDRRAMGFVGSIAELGASKGPKIILKVV